MRKRSEMVDLEDGYKLHVYDSGEMQIYKPRPYVFGDTSHAVSFDGGKTWQIRMEHETAFSHSFDVVDTVVCRTSDFSDILFLVEEWDNDPSNERFVDKW